jgi:hypothetical protein
MSVTVLLEDLILNRREFLQGSGLMLSLLAPRPCRPRRLCQGTPIGLLLVLTR